MLENVSGYGPLSHRNLHSVSHPQEFFVVSGGSVAATLQCRRCSVSHVTVLPVTLSRVTVSSDRDGVPVTVSAGTCSVTVVRDGVSSDGGCSSDGSETPCGGIAVSSRAGPGRALQAPLEVGPEKKAVRPASEAVVGTAQNPLSEAITEKRRLSKFARYGPASSATHGAVSTEPLLQSRRNTNRQTPSNKRTTRSYTPTTYPPNLPLRAPPDPSPSYPSPPLPPFTLVKAQSDRPQVERSPASALPRPLRPSSPSRPQHLSCYHHPSATIATGSKRPPGSPSDRPRGARTSSHARHASRLTTSKRHTPPPDRHSATQDTAPPAPRVRHSSPPPCIPPPTARFNQPCHHTASALDSSNQQTHTATTTEPARAALPTPSRQLSTHWLSCPPPTARPECSTSRSAPLRAPNTLPPPASPRAPFVPPASTHDNPSFLLNSTSLICEILEVVTHPPARGVNRGAQARTNPWLLDHTHAARDDCAPSFLNPNSHPTP
ncbi:unnamed protein product [Gadus morhua 'NCC']